MTCDELKNLAQSGRLQAMSAEPDVRAHLSGCAECEALYGANAPVVRILVEGVVASASGGDNALGFELGDFEALRGDMSARLRDETNDPWNLLRDRKTSVRRSIVLVTVVVSLGLCLALSARADLAWYPLPRLVIELGFLFTLVGAAVWEGTRTLAEPPRQSNHRRAILAACVTAPLVLALASSWAPVTPTSGTASVHSVLSCVSWGTAVALPAAFVLWLSKRRNPWAEASAPLLAATLGVVGNLLLQIHCPSSEFVHLICAHAPLILVFALGLGLWGKVTANRALE